MNNKVAINVVLRMIGGIIFRIEEKLTFLNVKRMTKAFSRVACGSLFVIPALTGCTGAGQSTILTPTLPSSSSAQMTPLSLTPSPSSSIPSPTQMTQPTPTRPSPSHAHAYRYTFSHTCPNANRHANTKCVTFP
jgi:hypothetical protein